MLKTRLLLLILLFASANANAGFSYSSYDSRGSVVAAVEIEGQGVYNLVMSVQFLNEPYDKKQYTSDEYEGLINRLSTEWHGVALKVILANNKYKISDLQGLELKVNKAIKDLVNNTRNKYGINNNAEVVYSITSFYLVDTRVN